MTLLLSCLSCESSDWISCQPNHPLTSSTCLWQNQGWGILTQFCAEVAVRCFILDASSVPHHTRGLDFISFNQSILGSIVNTWLYNHKNEFKGVSLNESDSNIITPLKVNWVHFITFFINSRTEYVYEWLSLFGCGSFCSVFASSSKTPSEKLNVAGYCSKELSPSCLSGLGDSDASDTSSKFQ